MTYNNGTLIYYDDYEFVMIIGVVGKCFLMVVDEFKPEWVDFSIHYF